MFDVVKVAKNMPRRYGKNGELLIPYEDTEAYRRGSVRRASMASQGAQGPGVPYKAEGDVAHDEEKSVGSK